MHAALATWRRKNAWCKEHRSCDRGNKYSAFDGSIAAAAVAVDAGGLGTGDIRCAFKANRFQPGTIGKNTVDINAASLLGQLVVIRRGGQG